MFKRPTSEIIQTTEEPVAKMWRGENEKEKLRWSELADKEKLKHMQIMYIIGQYSQIKRLKHMQDVYQSVNTRG